MEREGFEGKSISVYFSLNDLLPLVFCFYFLLLVLLPTESLWASNCQTARKHFGRRMDQSGSGTPRAFRETE